MKRFKADVFRCLQTLSQPAVYTCFLLITVILSCFNFMLCKLFPYEAELVAADIIIYTFDVRLLPISTGILTAFASSTIIKRDFEAQICLRFKSKLYLFIDQVKRISLFSIVTSLYIQTFNLIFGVTATDALINFTHYNSRYFMWNNECAEAEPNFILFFAVSVIMMCLMVFIMGLIMITMKWLFNSYIGGYFIIIAVAVAEQLEDFYALFKSIGPNYYKWHDIKYMLTDLSVPLLWIVILTCITLISLKRREFNSKNE